MKILVVGGSGFIASQLVYRLADAGHCVTIYDNNIPNTDRFPHILADVRDLEALSTAVRGVDVIYNLAAEHRDDVKPLHLYYDVNVGGARNVVIAAEQAGINTIVFTSSVSVYGESSKPLNENAPHRFFNEYGRTKSLAEAEYLAWAAADGRRNLIIVRPSVVFGPGNRGNVYNLLRQISSGRFIMVGNGRNRKSMAYVDNVAAFLVTALDVGSGVHIFNYADRPTLDMNTLVSLIRRQRHLGDGVGPRLPLWLARSSAGLADVAARVSGRTLAISAVRVAKFVANTEIDAGRAFESGFRAPVELEDGLVRTIDAEFAPKTHVQLEGRPYEVAGR
jgi:nucleoside-diphosphate-sugar epimerase